MDTRIKKALLLIAIFLYIIGFGFGFAVCCINKEPFISVCVIVLGVFGFPTFKAIFKKLGS